MGKTVWVDEVERTPKSWLLVDGTVAQEPKLETSGGGLKTRLKHDPEVSMYTKDVEQLVWEAVKRAAKANGTTPWIALGDENEQRYGLLRRALGKDEDYEGEVNVHDMPAELHIVSDDRSTRNNSSTTALWEFEHPSLPVKAVLTVTLYTGWRTNVTTHLWYHSTDPRDAERPTYRSRNDGDPRWSMSHERTYGETGEKLNQFFQANKPDYVEDIPFGANRHETERLAVQELARVVRLIEQEHDRILIPDLRDPENPAWLELDAARTNVSGAFKQSLADYLDGAPTVEQIAEVYEKMQALFRSVGVVVENLDEDSIQRALGGSESALNVKIGPVAKEGGEDPYHKVTFNLATGTIVVSCDHQETPKEEVATAWELALTKAEITGQEDDLLAFAREYARGQQEARVQRILDERSSNA